jgi:Carboxypeptidase regulatory-like domain/TonB-dependent Receptor Plug Domain/TonB dependent receptor
LNAKKRMQIYGTSIALILNLFFVISMYSQVTGATLSGTVTDSTGGVIAGAEISVINTATGANKTVMVDSGGYYSIPNLPAGAYEVSVTATGFAKAMQSNLNLAVGAQQQLNFSLKIGGTTETLQVNETAPQIDLSSSTLTAQVESQTVLELPLNGRDWTALATLQPGVNGIESQMSYDTAARGNRGFGAELTISGQRPTQNNYRLDGVSINDYANSGPGNVIGIALGVDAIQEFSVLTGSFSAEYGRASGGVVNAITKSGTNSFHGDAYEFLRNSALDAKDYFSSINNTPKAAFRRNQFGVAAGGPIIKDKTFIFGDYEGLRQGKGITTSVTVPSDNARLGILAGQAAAGNAAGTPCTQHGATGHWLSPLASNCVDDSAAAMLAMYPHANAAVSGNLGQYINSGLQIVPENFYTFRADHTLSAHDTLFGTYLYDDTDYLEPDNFNNVYIHSHTRRQTLALEENHTFGSSFVNSARFGYNRSRALIYGPAGGINPAASLTSLGSTTGETAARVYIGSGTTGMQGGVGSGAYYIHPWNSFQYYDDAFWTHGAHSIKFGAGIERMQYNLFSDQNPGGRWNFGGLTDFLSNNPSHFEAGIPSTATPREFRQTLFGGYVQDDWRVRPNLTLNIGVRYEMVTVLNDAKGKITDLVNISDAGPRCGVQYSNPAFASIPGGACTSVGPYYSNPTTRNFEPRVGFAWDPFRDGKTSVRGGFGIYDVLPLPGYFLLQQNQAAPFFIFASVDAPSPTSGLANPLAGQFFAGGQTLLTNPPAGVQPGKLSASVAEQNPHRNYVEQWNLNVQRQLSSDLSLTVGYVGSHGVHMLMRGDDGNMTTPTLTSAGYMFGGPKINQSLGIIRYLYWGSDSFYDGLNVNVDKKLGHGFQLQAAYTWSKSIDDDSSTIAGDSFSNGLNSLFYAAPRALRGPSDFNIGQSLTINGLWVVPTPKFGNGLVKAALGGWQLGSIFKINSGIPTTPIIGGDPMGVGNGGADQFGIPNRIAGCDPVNHNFKSTPSLNYFNLSCFTLPTVSASSPAAANCTTFSGAGAPPTGQVYCANLLGNSGRNSVVGPKLVNMDFSMFKNNPIHRISETFNVQFRAEIFNILNHANFAPPEPTNGGTIFNPNGSAAGSGGIDNLTTQPRDVQFAVKVIW